MAHEYDDSQASNRGKTPSGVVFSMTTAASVSNGDLTPKATTNPNLFTLPVVPFIGPKSYDGNRGH